MNFVGNNQPAWVVSHAKIEWLSLKPLKPYDVTNVRSDLAELQKAASRDGVRQRKAAQLRMRHRKDVKLSEKWPFGLLTHGANISRQEEIVDMCNGWLFDAEGALWKKCQCLGKSTFDIYYSECIAQIAETKEILAGYEVVVELAEQCQQTLDLADSPICWRPPSSDVSH